MSHVIAEVERNTSAVIAARRRVMSQKETVLTWTPIVAWSYSQYLAFV